MTKVIFSVAEIEEIQVIEKLWSGSPGECQITFRDKYVVIKIKEVKDRTHKEGKVQEDPREMMKHSNQYSFHSLMY